MNYHRANPDPDGPAMHVLARRLLLASCLWMFGYPALSAVPTNPLLLGDSIFVSQHGVYRFDLKTGGRLWSSLPGVETFELVAHEDMILAGSTQGLYALAADDGSVIWHLENSRTVFTPSISANAFAGSLHGELYAIDPRQGRVIWRHQFPGWIYSPAVNELSPLLWTGGQAHRVFALTRDGDLRYDISTAQEAVFSPVDIGEDRVAFNLFDGSTLVISAQHGKVLGVIAGDSQPSGLKRDGGTVYRSHRDGSLDAFDRDRLERRWHRSLASPELRIHPSLPGYLLLSDSNHDLLLLDLEQDDICRTKPQGDWNLPLQIETDRVAVFESRMQPPTIKFVQPRAFCK